MCEGRKLVLASIQLVFEGWGGVCVCASGLWTSTVALTGAQLSLSFVAGLVVLGAWSLAELRTSYLGSTKPRSRKIQVRSRRKQPEVKAQELRAAMDHLVHVIHCPRHCTSLANDNNDNNSNNNSTATSTYFTSQGIPSLPCVMPKA